MQHQRQRKATMRAATKPQKPDRFTHLLAEVRSGLGDHWTFYEECIDGVLDAAANQQDTTAWFEQMQQLVEGVDKQRNQQRCQQSQQHCQQQQQQQRQKQLLILRDNVLSFDFSASVLPGLTFPEDFRAYHCPRDEIIITENYVSPPPNPLRKGSHDPVLFSSPTLKTNIAELFGYAVQRKDNDQRHSHSTWQAPPALPYGPEDDDLVVWKKRSEDEIDDQHNEVKAGFDTWPAWNPRFDLEM
ncbi:hypothetical protein N0V86_006087 [Didymella sp. IMI 355093]|nr:hypothetical protein N0V86_006087 [Didymella sp. IMI 355093]